MLTKKTKGKYVIIGLGGAFTAEDTYEKIQLGASLVQLITGMVFRGPSAISDINLGLANLLKKDGMIIFLKQYEQKTNGKAKI
jgi:dihydroorotate dehydrogenase